MTHKLAVGMGVMFCSFVAILLLILYYPKDAAEEEFDTFTPGGAYNADVPQEVTTRGTVVVVARSLEDFGAAFLALVAVGCIVAGLSCLACACCCMVE